MNAPPPPSLEWTAAQIIQQQPEIKRGGGGEDRPLRALLARERPSILEQRQPEVNDFIYSFLHLFLSLSFN